MKFQKLRITALLVVLGSFGVELSAGVVVGNEITDGVADYGDHTGQSFMLPAGATVAAIQLHIGSTGAMAGSVRVDIWEANGVLGRHFSRLGSSPVASGVLVQDDVSPTPGWSTVVLDVPYTNFSDHEVYLVFELDLLTSGASGWNNYSYSDNEAFEAGHQVYWNGQEYVIGDGRDLTFRILDATSEMLNVVAFTASTTEVVEGNSPEVSISIHGSTEGEVVLSFWIEALTDELESLDFQQTQSFWHSGGAESSQNQPHQLNVYFGNDSRINGPRRFRLHMRSESPDFAVGGQSSIEVSILDDEVAGTVSFEPVSAVLHEDAGQLTVKIQRFENDPGSLAVNVVSGGGNAVPEVDYTPVNQTVVFPEGVYEVELVVIGPPNEPSIHPERNFFLDLVAADPGVIIGDRARVKVTINDSNDVGSMIPGYEFPFPEPTYFISDIEIVGDGSIIALTWSRRPSDDQIINRITRFDHHGRAETSWELPDANRFGSTCLEVCHDGRIFVGGLGHISRFFPNGERDDSWNNPLVETTDQVQDLHATADGGVIAVGQISAVVEGSSRRQAIRCLQDGSIDPSFDLGVIAPLSGSAWIHGIEPTPCGKLLVAGNFQSFNGVSRRFLARIFPDGTLDPSFDASDPVRHRGRHARDPAIQPDGSIIFSTGDSTGSVMKVLSDGSVDPIFVPVEGSLLGVQPDGKFLVFLFNDKISRYHPNGELDASWATWSRSATGLTGIAISPSGYLHCMGQMNRVDGRVPTGVPTLRGGQGASGGFVEWESDPLVVGERIGSVMARVHRWGFDSSSAAGAFFTATLAGQESPPLDEPIGGFIPFVSDSNSQPVDIPIPDDDRGNENRLLELFLHDPMGGVAVGSRMRLALTVVDDDQESLAHWLAGEAPENPMDAEEIWSRSKSTGVPRVIRWMTGLPAGSAALARMPFSGVVWESHGGTLRRHLAVSFFYDARRHGFDIVVEVSNSLQSNAWRPVWRSTTDPNFQSALVESAPNSGTGWATIRSDQVLDGMEFIRIRYEKSF